ncbi:MAG: hypothetical protein K8I60_06685 [Anaerolineae bacterium]|nr:hypothetical protein [Anaerolineae bacterium]
MTPHFLGLCDTLIPPNPSPKLSVGSSLRSTGHFGSAIPCITLQGHAASVGEYP